MNTPTRAQRRKRERLLRENEPTIAADHKFLDRLKRRYRFRLASAAERALHELEVAPAPSCGAACFTAVMRLPTDEITHIVRWGSPDLEIATDLGEVVARIAFETILREEMARSGGGR